VEVLGINADTDTRRERFLRVVFGNLTNGYFCIAYGPKNRDPKKFREEFFHYPNEIPRALELINRVYQGNNVWFCPHLFVGKKRRKETVLYTPSAWSDLDTCEPDNLFIEPTVLIESSPGRYQGLWMFERQVDPDDAEALSQRIAYTHANDGADRSGWDLTQLLRMPFTYNYKYATTPIVTPIEINRKRYRLEDFDEDYAQVSGYAHVEARALPETTGGLSAEDLLESRRLTISPTIWRLYNEKLSDEASWSEPLWKLMLYLFEAGYTAEQVFVIVQEAGCNKYARDEAPLRMLWKDVLRAETKFKAQSMPVEAHKADYIEKELVSDEERRDVMSEDSFVERYIEWAKSLGDAAPQYHQAGAFTALSALLAGSVELPTSFGTIKPNLWFMILADTTLTRKSTAMDIAMDLVTEIDEDVVMATDGSLEGMMTSLSTRAGRPSVFLRDEFSGLLEMITKKDYYAGMPETLTKLYDGKMQKRVLRKESIEVKDPCLLVFAGGIKNKITGLLSFEHVSSGFMPRFVFITAESDITRVKPLGPPTSWTDDTRNAIKDELTDLYTYFNRTTPMTIKGTSLTFDARLKFQAKLTAEAWSRYNVLETQMLDAGINMDRSEIMTPVYDRLSKSILKAAVLLACSRQRSDPVVVEESDIIRAAVYGESWRMYVREIMDNVGKGQTERLYDNIIKTIQRKPGVSRSTIMQSYHLSARDTNAVFETLEQRGLITREKQGKREVLWPAQINAREKFNG
jgi:hypothetical protein